MTLFKRSNDVEVGVSPEFDKEHNPGETPIRAGIYRCEAADVKSVPMPPSHFRWSSIPGIRRLKGQFDGEWLSPRSKNRTERTGATAAARAACRMEPHVASDRGGHHEVVQIVCAESHVRLKEITL